MDEVDFWKLTKLPYCLITCREPVDVNDDILEEVLEYQVDKMMEFYGMYNTE